MKKQNVVLIFRFVLAFIPIMLLFIFYDYLDTHKIYFSAYAAVSGTIAAISIFFLLLPSHLVFRTKVSISVDYTYFYKKIINRYNLNHQLKELLAAYEQVFTEVNPFKAKTIFIFFKDNEWQKKEINNLQNIKPISINTFQNELPKAKKRLRIKFSY